MASDGLGERRESRLGCIVHFVGRLVMLAIQKVARIEAVL